jgi:DNA-binding CsgD family transcriptional regulator
MVYNSFVGNLLEILGRRTNPGILILDMNNKLSYANKEALDILPAFCKKPTRTMQEQIPEAIHLLCDQLKNSVITGRKDEVCCSVMENLPGLVFSLRAFFLSAGETAPTHTMVLIEKISERREADFARAIADFSLSKREAEVLRLLCHGHTNKEIAGKLFISQYTVKDHIKKIMQKMDVKSRSEIIAIMK